MKKLIVETLVPEHFEYLARDKDGKVFAFQNKPELTTDIDCDTWDVDEGEVLQITDPISVSEEEINSQLGNWKESLIDLKDSS
tara:strand:- start:30 stop:278 length:249 start_codon:yes stop_codon:yes gene_type:complete